MQQLPIIISFHPETALSESRRLVYLGKSCVNLRNCLCDVLKYDSAQLLDFLDFAQNFSFPNWKRLYVASRKKLTFRMDTS